MARMISIGYPLIISLSILSQGFLFSFSKSIRKSENDDMLLDPISLRKAFQNGDTLEKSVGNPNDRYKPEDSNILNEDEERSIKRMDFQHSYQSHDSLPLSIGIKQLPYLTIKNSLHQTEAEDKNVDLTQDRRDIGDEENGAKIPIGRRDFDMLRCMLGRVYRPCWQI
ncbi:pro-MCH [Rhinophrynus dorsalis]